jgi:3'(2'), 5'-bisphosphate nucleotidase
MRDLDALTQALLPVAAAAGAAIMGIYDGEFAVQRKQDNSPLTLADLESQRIILEALRTLTPGLPVLAEELANAPWAERRHWREVWVVDPLDGTREFVKRNGEFTVNIALVIDHEPVLGCIGEPARRQL